MIEQVAADVRGLHDRRDAVLAELVAITHAGEHQQLRGVDRATAQQYLAPRPRHLPASVLVELDADGTLTLEQHLCRHGTCQQGQVRPLERRPQVRIRCTPPRTAALRHTRFAEALWLSLIGLLNPITAFLDGL